MNEYLVCSGGDGGRVVVWRLGHEVPGQTVAVPGDKSVSALWADGSRVFAAAGGTVARIELSLEGEPQLVAHRDFGALPIRDLCVLPGGPVVLASPNAALLCDPDSLETVDRVVSGVPVRHVRPSGEGALITIDTEGHIIRRRLTERRSELYFSGGWPEPHVVADAWSGGDGEVSVALNNGFVARYEAPGPPTQWGRGADHSIGGLAAVDDWLFVLHRDEVIALDATGERRFCFRTESTARKSAVRAAQRLLFVLDELGTLAVFGVDPLAPGLDRTASYELPTGLKYGNALAIVTLPGPDFEIPRVPSDDE